MAACNFSHKASPVTILSWGTHETDNYSKDASLSKRTSTSHPTGLSPTSICGTECCIYCRNMSSKERGDELQHCSCASMTVDSRCLDGLQPLQRRSVTSMSSIPTSSSSQVLVNLKGTWLQPQIWHWCTTSLSRNMWFAPRLTLWTTTEPTLSHSIGKPDVRIGGIPFLSVCNQCL